MARKRYHYDARGRLKGYTTDKYQPRLRDIALVLALVAGIGVWNQRTDKKESPREPEQKSKFDIEMLQTWCSWKKNGMDNHPAYPKNAFELNGKKYINPCTALTDNKLPITS